jgi:hypothetical protein
MFTQSIAALFAVFMPFSHHATVAPSAPAAIVQPAATATPHDAVAPVTPPVTTVTPKPPAVEGPQPVGPSQTLQPLPNRCIVTVTGQTTQSGPGPSQTGSGPATFSMPCDQAYAYTPPAGTTDTVTPVPASDTATTGA